MCVCVCVCGSEKDGHWPTLQLGKSSYGTKNSAYFAREEESDSDTT